MCFVHSIYIRWYFRLCEEKKSDMLPNLDLNKCFKQIKLSRSLGMCESISELPSHKHHGFILVSFRVKKL